MNIRVKTGIVVFILGLLGVLSMLLADIALPLPQEVLDMFTPTQWKFLILINPTILLIFMTVLGAAFAHRCGLHAPLIERALGSSLPPQNFAYDFGIGAIAGLLTGVAIAVVSSLLSPYLPKQMAELEANMQLPALTKFLYGGITEEVMVRWGLMSFLVWLGWKITSSKRDRPTNAVFVVAIVVSAIIFGLGHLPVLYSLLGAEHITLLLLCYIIIANSIFGIVAGWLYWKKGLETAMVAHIFAHVGMMAVGVVS